MFSSSRRRLPAAAAVLCAGVLVLSSCGSDNGRTSDDGGQIEVVAAFYPLEFVTGRVAGDLANVSGLTRPGAEPHDIELTPKDVAKISEADLLVYLAGFQPAVDEAVDQEAAYTSVEVTEYADLHAAEPAEDGEAEHAAEDEGDEHEGEDENGRDPHFWLDPTRLAKVADGVADRLAELDPDDAETYRDNAAALGDDLDTLDREFTDGLANCQSMDLVTSHEAFGYLAEKYGLEQLGISGISPEQEPSPAQLADAAAFVRKHDVETIYYETLVSPTVAQTLARETGARVDVLDPIEGLTDESRGDDYLSVMRSNLKTLKKGQACS